MLPALDPSLVTFRDSGRPARWWVGIDGGGTSTRALVADASGQLLGRGESGASALNQGVSQAWRHIAEAIDRAGVPDLQLQVRLPRNMLGDKAHPGMAVTVLFGRIDPLTNELKVREAREAE